MPVNNPDIIKNTIAIHFTEEALQHIQKMLMPQDGEKKYFRLSLKQTGCSGYMYKPEIVKHENPKDLVIAITNSFNCFIDSDSAPLMHGTEVDFITKTFGQSQIVFKHPNATGACGCGESFTIKET